MQPSASGPVEPPRALDQGNPNELLPASGLSDHPRRNHEHERRPRASPIGPTQDRRGAFATLTIIGTCMAQGVNPRAYLHLVTRLTCRPMDCSPPGCSPTSMLRPWHLQGLRRSGLWRLGCPCFCTGACQLPRSTATASRFLAGSPFSAEQILERDLVERQVGDEPLELAGFLLELALT